MFLIWISFVLLSVLAILHLVVGVSNDAVNFLNSAIGSRVSSRKVILIIAGIGLLTGTFFAGGMMDVARNGVIYPESFSLTELLIIFLAVVIVNIVIIDSFNTLGFPTSTTILVIFSLIGGALAMSLFKDSNDQGYTSFINTNKAFLVFAGILVSVFLAFIFGAVVQFITRLVFTFRFKGRFLFLFSVAGAVAITSILFLIIKKDIGGYLPMDDYINMLPFGKIESLGVLFASTFILFWGLGLIFNINIPRLVVFFGTFALALSFAANDLVNFIGLPLTGIESIKAFLTQSGNNPGTFKLEFLNKNWIQSNPFNDIVYLWVFLLSGIIMIVAIFYSKKSESVTDTEIYLGRQTHGYERFEPSPLSRLLVRQFLFFYNKMYVILPTGVKNFCSARFEQPEPGTGVISADNEVFFDTVRASVNLVVASILISIGTYYRFPLSTTFIVFMVSMGTSLSDRAWGRESAVYRISGVLSILGGWFITAFLGFLGSFFITILIWWGGIIAILLLFLLTIVFLWRTTVSYRRKREKEIKAKNVFYNEAIESIEWLHDAGSEKIRRELLEVSKIYFLILHGLMTENINQAKEGYEKSIALKQSTNKFKGEMFLAYSKLPDESQDSGQLFVQALDYLSELSNTLGIIAPMVFYHVENQHKGLTSSQFEDINVLQDEVASFFNFMIHLEKEKRFSSFSELKQKQNNTIELIDDLRLVQIRRIRAGEGKTRINVIFMEILGETKNLMIYAYNLFQALREFHMQSVNTKHKF